MKKLLFFMLFLAAALVVGGLLLPTRIHVERSIAINRPAVTLFTLLNGFRSFNRWSPWASLDPDAKYWFTGPRQGVGARMQWSGDPSLVGTGWQEITASMPHHRVEIHLDFGPQGLAESYFDIRGDQVGSRVTWGFDTDVSEGQGFFGALMGRYFGLFLDRWVGADYEKGLAAFKAYAESLPEHDFSGAEIEELDAKAHEILYVSGQSSQEAADIETTLATAYRTLMAFIGSHGIEVAGEPMAITRAWEGHQYLFDAAIPVATAVEDPSGRVQAGLSPSGPAVRIVHMGPYETSGRSYEHLNAYMAAHGLVEGELTWEHYISDPAKTEPDDLITHIYIQLAGED